MTQFNHIDFDLCENKIEYVKNCNMESMDFYVEWRLIWHSIYSYNEKFIREFKNFVIWPIVSKKPDLSIDFLLDFQEELDWTYVTRFNKCITHEFIEKYLHLLNPLELYFRITVDKDFHVSDEYKNKLLAMENFFGFLKEMNKQRKKLSL